MAGPMFNELEELVANACDNLYARRQLITINSIKNALAFQRELHAQEIADLPTYINNWRLHNLQGDATEPCLRKKIKDLETQLATQQLDLHAAKQTIAILRTEIMQQRHAIIQCLRDVRHV